MANLSVTDIRPVEVKKQFTAPAGVAISKGQMVRFDTSSGKIVLANAASAANARVRGIALQTAIAGQTTTVVQKGIVDVGNALAALSYDQDVYLSNTDGTLADAAGTTSKVAGIVVPGYSSETPDKLLWIDL